MIVRTLRNLGRFARFGMAPLTVSVPILGALAADSRPTFWQVYILALIGLSAHSFGFGLNDLMDLNLDRTVPIRQSSPLISGRLSERVAWGFVLLQIPFSLLLYASAFETHDGLLVLCISITLAALYNLFSKWGRIPRILPEVALAASIGLLCAAGALSINPLTENSIIFAGTLALILLLLNSVPSGLKDLKTDAEFGARSFLIGAGGHFTDDDHYVLPGWIMFYAGGLQLVILVGLLTLIVSLHPALWAGVLALICAGLATLHLRMILIIRAFSALRRSMSLLNGYYNYVALVLLLAHKMGLLLQVLLLLITLRLCLIPVGISRRVWQARHDPIYEP